MLTVELAGLKILFFMQAREVLSMRNVFHLNVDDASKQSELLGNLQNLMDSQTDVEEIAVVLNSYAVEMVEEGSEAEEFIEEFVEKDIHFYACENSLENRDISREEVVEGIETVPAGVGKIAELQDNGFNYIKI